jgi:hypothetical protein
VSEEEYAVMYREDGTEKFTAPESMDAADARARRMTEVGHEVIAVVTRGYATTRRQITPEDLVGPEAAERMRRSVARLEELSAGLRVVVDPEAVQQELTKEDREMEQSEARRGRDSGEALGEVRTVYSRALTALENLGPSGTKLEWPTEEEYPSYSDRRRNRFEDPDAEAMRNALEQVVRLLEPWRKTGRTTRSTCL